MIELLNKCWKASDFGYPIHTDVRIPDSVAENLHIEFLQKVNDNLLEDENGQCIDVRQMLKNASEKSNKPEFKNEFERLLRQWERSQKESLSRLNKKDPLAEFENLFKKWKQIKNNI